MWRLPRTLGGAGDLSAGTRTVPVVRHRVARSSRSSRSPSAEFGWRPHAPQQRAINPLPLPNPALQRHAACRFPDLVRHLLRSAHPAADGGSGDS